MTANDAPARAGAAPRAGSFDHCSHCPEHCKRTLHAARHYTTCPVCVPTASAKGEVAMSQVVQIAKDYAERVR